MLRLRALRCHSHRLFHHGTVCQDHVMGQLRACTAEDQLFDVVNKNKAKLSFSHVGLAMGLLWQFQRERPEMLRTVKLIRAHPQFLTLRVLAENKISLMDDATVVDILYGGLRYVTSTITENWLLVTLHTYSTHTHTEPSAKVECILVK